MIHYQKLCEAVTTPGEQPAVVTTEFPSGTLHYSMRLVGVGAIECTCAIQEKIFDDAWVTPHDVKIYGTTVETVAFDSLVDTGAVRLVITNITGALTAQVAGDSR